MKWYFVKLPIGTLDMSTNLYAAKAGEGLLTTVFPQTRFEALPSDAIRLRDSLPEELRLQAQIWCLDDIRGKMEKTKLRASKAK
jgi:hypothetical protein